MYDYGARFYMPDAVIWGQYDPLAEITFQPYAYAYNNPIFFNDPTGMIGEGTGSGGDPEFYKNGKVTEIQEVVITKVSAVKNQSAGVSLPSNCVACFASGNFSFPEPKPKIDPYANCGWCHDGPIKYIGGAGDPWSCSKVSGRYGFRF